MIKNLLDLSGKNALVTGSSQGIGKAIALGLAEFGANVLVHYRHDEDEARSVMDEIAQFGVKTGAIGVDLLAPTAAHDLIEKAREQFDSIDILVLNASIQQPRLWHDTTPDEFDKQVTANWKSTLFAIQYVLPSMIERGWGRIITIGSVQEERPHPTMVVYAGTKAAVANTVRNMAIQVADQGVTINNLSPGVIKTPRTAEPTPPVQEHISQRMGTLVNHEGLPEDIAGMAVLLSSEAGRYITGQTIFVDGGMSL